MRSGILKHLGRSFNCALRPPVTQNVSKKMIGLVGIPTQQMSTAAPEQYKYINLKTEVQKGVAVIEMKKKPVNTLNLEMLTELNIAIEKLEIDKSCRGLIIASLMPVFSAGLDIMEMYQPQEDRLRAFWTAFQELVIRLCASPLAVIGALNGSTIAGGCAIAFSTDYRIMADGKHMIGLNETQIGLAAPPWLIQLTQRTVGLREAEKMLHLSLMPTPQDALKVGAVDAVVPQDQIMDAALKEMNRWLALPDIGRQMTKQIIRQEFVDNFRRIQAQDVDKFAKMVQYDSVQKMMGLYLEALKAKAQ